jgi:hypothetical protein
MTANQTNPAAVNRMEVPNVVWEKYFPVSCCNFMAGDQGNLMESFIDTQITSTVPFMKE